MKKGSYVLLSGDCVNSMRGLPDAFINTCVTSPPYYGLRDYGDDGQIGLEETPEEYIENIVGVFREVRRVLRDDGTLWLNLGDSYYNYRPGRGQSMIKQTLGVHKNSEVENCPKRGNKLKGLKEKDLIGIPWRVALALQADGWYLRQDIIWNKPNPMPESVKDRCTKSHEYIFLLSKRPHYYFDNEAIKEPAVSAGQTRGGGKKYSENAIFGNREDAQSLSQYGETSEFRNKRSVWSVGLKPYKGAHFATFPPELILPAVLAGSPENGIVLDPFGGSGTTAGIAINHGRNAILCELNKEYEPLIQKRIASIKPEQAVLICRKTGATNL